MHKTILTILLGLSLPSFAQPSQKLNSTHDGVETGIIGESVETQGVTVINGKVWIDGQAVPPQAKRFKAKDGTVYQIIRHSKSVEVRSE